VKSIGQIVEIRKLAQEDKIIISKHANARMIERDVLPDDIVLITHRNSI
jgi:hypothetical protein